MVRHRESLVWWRACWCGLRTGSTLIRRSTGTFLNIQRERLSPGTISEARARLKAIAPAQEGNKSTRSFWESLSWRWFGAGMGSIAYHPYTARVISPDLYAVRFRDQMPEHQVVCAMRIFKIPFASELASFTGSTFWKVLRVGSVDT
jgi:hypothetical protein